jgi:carbon-monoxide dehydrogenase large subunit
MHGGIVQGLGQALCEQCIYDPDSGQILTGSFMDYRIPKATDFPRLIWVANRTDTTTNPLGVKGAGEAGTTAAPPAFMNAVVDAMSEFGVRNIDMPATPEKIWRACQGS